MFNDESDVIPVMPTRIFGRLPGSMCCFDPLGKRVCMPLCRAYYKDAEGKPQCIRLDRGA